jgi:GrpB-like predicted nucleotidyltransferase (UPF0157 family)
VLSSTVDFNEAVDGVDHVEGELVLIGGRERRPIVIVEHDPAWAVRYENERQRIAGALGARARRIEHFGSTSVPGLAAKPIIDVLVAVDDVQHEGTTSALESAGYVLRVREPGHRMLRTPERDVHVHLWIAGSDDVRRHLLLRDWLRVDDSDRVLYERVKRALAAHDWEDTNDYAQAKTGVITSMTARAEAWAQRTGWMP